MLYIAWTDIPFESEITGQNEGPVFLLIFYCLCYHVFVLNITKVNFKRWALIFRGLVWQNTIGFVLCNREFNHIRSCRRHHIFVSSRCRLLCCSTLESLGCVHYSVLVLRQSSGKLCTFPRGMERASILISHCHNSLTSELWLLIELFAVPYHNSSFGHKIIENILIWAWLHYLFLNLPLTLTPAFFVYS